MPNKSSVTALPERLFQAQAAYEGRKGQRLRREDFAEMVGVSQPTASDWFSGNRTPSLVQTEQIAKALGVRPSWLAFNDGQMEAVLVSSVVRSDQVTAVPVPLRETAKKRTRRAG